MSKFKKVILGISGGVDSAVAALLLKNRGFNVHGVFMKNWDLVDEFGVCTSTKDLNDAKFVCDKLNIPFKEINFVKNYWTDVFSTLLHEYSIGYTPNPDILCNKFIKFDLFVKYALEKLNADAIATGHYVKTSFGNFLENYDESSDPRLLCSKDASKDQTLFLSQISNKALRKTMFPLGDLMKTEVKKIAEMNGLELLSRKKESVGICFIGPRNFQDFISEYLPDKTGPFIDIDKNIIVGEHKGFHYWTIGQRCRIQNQHNAYFVAKKDISTNTIYVAIGSNHPALYIRKLFANNVHWIHSVPEKLKRKQILPCYFRFQHRNSLVKCKIFLLENNNLIISLDNTLRALTPGQFAVFYSENECLGSAKIYFAGPSDHTLMNTSSSL